MAREQIISKHGGYRKLKSFQIAQLVYDLTVRFCERYVDRFSRTKDQMIQAARSGVQNIAEGSQASGTSKKMELKLTNVARASLEELRLDYEDFLRQRRWVAWPREDPRRTALVERRCRTVDDVVAWVAEVHWWTVWTRWTTWTQWTIFIHWVHSVHAVHLVHPILSMSSPGPQAGAPGSNRK